MCNKCTDIITDAFYDENHWRKSWASMSTYEMFQKAKHTNRSLEAKNRSHLPNLYPLWAATRIFLKKINVTTVG
jgi:hypothetical protein